MITSLIEMLELPDFVHMTTSKIQFEPCDKFFGDVMNKSYDFITFTSKYFYFEKS